MPNSISVNCAGISWKQFFFRNENLLKVKEFKKNKLSSGDLKTIW